MVKVSDVDVDDFIKDMGVSVSDGKIVFDEREDPKMVQILEGSGKVECSDNQQLYLMIQKLLSARRTVNRVCKNGFATDDKIVQLVRDYVICNDGIVDNKKKELEEYIIELKEKDNRAMI